MYYDEAMHLGVVMLGKHYKTKLYRIIITYLTPILRTCSYLAFQGLFIRTIIVDNNGIDFCD